MTAELRRREALLQSILDTVPDGLIVIDGGGIIRSFNTAAERMFGFAAAEVAGRNVSMLMPDSHAAAHDGYLNRYAATREAHIIGIGRVTTGRRRSGATFPIELQIGEVDVAGSHLFTGFVRDLTERHDRERRLAELQAELIHVSRLSELGQMVSGLAHEVNQPLTAIAMYVQGIRRLLAPNDKPWADETPAIRQAIERIGEQADRAHRIVQGLRGMVRKEERPSQVADLETMVRETVDLALSGAGRSVSAALRIAADARLAWVNKVQIQQVLLNLIRNAVEAMAGAEVSRLTVSTARRGDRIEISVADNGPGLADAVRDRLFQPFVTTKEDGLGMGLSICRAIVEGHGGDITVRCEPGHGTEFSFTIAAAEDDAAIPDLDQ
jgi:two-component system sensor kinase FixL